MTPLFKKLNLGTARLVHVLNAPASFDAELAALDGVEVRRSASGKVGFAMAFVTTLDEVERAVQQVTRSTTDDATLWFVYPKTTSRRYRVRPDPSAQRRRERPAAAPAGPA